MGAFRIQIEPHQRMPRLGQSRMKQPWEDAQISGLEDIHVQREEAGRPRKRQDELGAVSPGFFPEPQIAPETADDHQKV